MLLGQLLLSLPSTTDLFGRNRGVNLILYIEFGIIGQYSLETNVEEVE